MRPALVVVLATVGLVFSLSGVVGIVRMPDLYTRIQSSSKTITMGTVPALLALVVGMGFYTTYGSRAVLVAVLLLVMNPLASHALARAAYKAGTPMWSGSVVDQVQEERTGEQAGGGTGTPEEGGSR